MDRVELYKKCTADVDALLTFSKPIDPDVLRTMGLANAASVLFYALNSLVETSQFPHLAVNWVGFYLVNSPTDLFLGPFQGKVACMHIKVGKGVCGTAVLTGKTQVVKNVHHISNHITCDTASVSEIVVPIRSGGQLVGVLDIDSTVEGFFDSTDAECLEQFCSVLGSKLHYDRKVMPYGAADTPKTASTPAPGRQATVQTKAIGNCTVSTSKLSIMASSTFLQSLEKDLGISALPEIIFNNNVVDLSIGDVAVSISAESFLRHASQYFETPLFAAERDSVTITCPPSWTEKRKTHTVFDPKIDWAFRAHFLGKWRRGADTIVPTPTDKRINWDVLRRTDVEIALFDSMDLFEDDLHDNGVSKVSCKVRLMATAVFVLVRHFVRIDGQVALAFETRFFHELDGNGVVIQYATKKRQLPKLTEGVRQTAIEDSEEFVATMSVESEEHYFVGI